MACMIAPVQAITQTLPDGFANTLTLTAGANTITVNGTDNANITSLITLGALTPADFTKEGTGTLTISGVSLNILTTKPLYTVNAGRLILNLSTANILAMSPNYDIKAGAFLQMNAGSFGSTLGVSGAGTLQFGNGDTTLTLEERSGATALTNNLIFGTGNSALSFDNSLTSMQGTINTGGSLTLSSNNVTTFGNAVTATGTLLLNRGADAAHAVRTFNGTASAGALSLQAGTSTVHSGITLNQGGTVTGALTAQGYADIAIAANKTLTAGSYVSTGGNNTVAGTLSLSGNATISGLNDIWTGTVNSANLYINTGASLSMNNASYTLGAGGQIAIGNTGTSGTGTLNITGTTTVSGASGSIAIGNTTGTAGALSIQNTAVVNTGGITINNGSATLSNTATLNIGASGIAGTGTVNFNGGTTIGAVADWSSASGITYAINGGAASTINTNGHNVTINGGISGTGILNKTGLGTLTITGSDKTFTSASAIAVSAGTLALNVSAANILAMAPSYSIASNATLQLNSGTYASPLKITGSGMLSFANGATSVTLKESSSANSLGNNITFGNVGSTLTLDSTLNTLQGTLTAGSDLTLNGSQFTTANGAVNVTGKLTLGLAGDAAHATRTFNSLVTAGSLTLQAGTSTIASAASFAQGATITGALTAQGYANIGAVAGQQISAGSYLSTGGHNTVTGSLNLSGNAVISGLNDIWTGTVNSANLSINSGASLSMNSATYTLGASGAINIGNTGTSGTGSLSVTGSSTVNGSTGTINIGNGSGTAGSLNIQNTSVVNTSGIVINNGSVTLSDTASLNIGSTGVSGTGTVNFNGGTTIKADADWTSASGVGYAVNGSTSSTLNTNGHDVTLNGNISGSGQLNKTGQGTLTISGGDKTFTGTTTATQGTVQVNANMYGTGNSYVAAGGTISISNTGSICTGGGNQAASTVQVTAKAPGVNATLSNANVTASGIVSVDTTGTVKAAVNNAKVTINRTGATIGHSVLNNTTVSLAQNASVTLNDVIIGTGTQLAAAAGVAATVNLQNTKLQITNAQLSGTLTSKVVAPIVRTDLFAGAQINVTGQLTVDLSNLHYNSGDHYQIISICLGALATTTSDVSLQLAGVNPEWKVITDNSLLAGVKLESAGGRDLTGTVLNSHGMDSNGCFYVLVPEPSSATLSLLALSALAMRRRRK